MKQPEREWEQEEEEWETIHVYLVPEGTCSAAERVWSKRVSRGLTATLALLLALLFCCAPAQPLSAQQTLIVPAHLLPVQR